MSFFSCNDGSVFLSESPLDDLRELLIEKTIAAGHALTFDEAKADPTMVDPNAYPYYFGGSFSKIAELIWTEVEFGQEEDENMTHNYGPEQLKAILYDFYEKNGRYPNFKEFGSRNNMPAYQTFINVLGPRRKWDEVVYGVLPEQPDTPEPTEVEPTKVEPTEVEPTEVEPTEVEPTEVEPTPEVEESTPDEPEPTPEVVEPAPETAGPVEDIDDSSSIVTEPIVDLATTSEGRISVKLEINLPDRDNPIILNLSF